MTEKQKILDRINKMIEHLNYMVNFSPKHKNVDLWKYSREDLQNLSRWITVNINED